MLSALLSQNPNVYTVGNSAVCQLMWDIQQSCRTTSRYQLSACKKFDEMQRALCKNVINAYYKKNNKKHVFDKCRSWTLPENMQMLYDYVTPSPKVVVLVRPIEDIVKSFGRLLKENGMDIAEQHYMLEDWTHPIMRSYNGAMHAKKSNTGEFLFVDYDSLVSNTHNELNRIYNFVGMDGFSHDLNNVVVTEPEDDNVYKIIGLHDVRRVVAKKTIDAVLPTNIQEKCKYLTDTLYDGLDYGQLVPKAV